MIDVYVFEFTKADFQRLPADERNVMLLAGHTLNLLGFWIKLLALTSKVQSDIPFVARLDAAQSHILLRSLGGVLVEAWEWLRKPANQLLIGKKYLPLLETQPRLSYEDLNKAFGASGLLHKIRNSFSYHYPNRSTIEAAFTAVPDEEDFQWYVTDENTSSFYFGCAALIDYGMIGLAGEDDPNVGFARILKETIAIGNAMSDFLGGLLAVMVHSHFPNPPRSRRRVLGSRLRD
jgi:hypothetical protein